MHQYYFSFPPPSLTYLAMACQSSSHITYKLAIEWKKLVVWKACCCNIRSIDETNGIQLQLNNNTTWPKMDQLQRSKGAIHNPHIPFFTLSFTTNRYEIAAKL
jgi:hypothetical protein